jgi:hypothetical protein
VEPSKTKIVRFSRFHPGRERGRTFTFLGFEFYWFKDRKGIVRAKRRTTPSKQRSALSRIKAWLKAGRQASAEEAIFQDLEAKAYRPLQLLLCTGEFPFSMVFLQRGHQIREEMVESRESAQKL